MELRWWEWAYIGVGGLALIALVSLCSRPADSGYKAECQEFCDDQDSKVLFCNEERKVVVCE